MSYSQCPLVSRVREIRIREDQAEKASKVLPPGKCRRQTTS